MLCARSANCSAPSSPLRQGLWHACIALTGRNGHLAVHLTSPAARRFLAVIGVHEVPGGLQASEPCLARPHEAKHCLGLCLLRTVASVSLKRCRWGLR